MRVADYVADYIYQQGIHHIFMVTGGGMMFLSDGVAKHPHLKAICTHHEQAAAMAAISYAKYNENLGVCYVTTGCGGINAMMGLLDAWQDNIPCLFISGQVKRKDTVYNSGLNLRQMGVQEVNIVPVVQSLSKYAVMINKPELVAYHLDKALFLARSGRPGPVWLDIPLDVQGAAIDPGALLHFSEEEKSATETVGFPTKSEIDRVYQLLKKAKMPIVVAGNGIRLGKAINEFKTFVESFQIPFVSSKLGVDLIYSEHSLYVGSIGIKGSRAGNMAVQNADLVLSIGCRLSVCSTGHEYDQFAREASIVVVDIDPIEHKKNTIKIDHFIHSDAKTFLEKLTNCPVVKSVPSWVDKCQHWKKKYPVYQAEYSTSQEGINLYHFIHCLGKVLNEDAVVVSDAGSAGYVTTQAMQFKQGQRSIYSGGQMEMGYTLPATIGVSFVEKKAIVIGITGDGSFQMNIQELQTIVHYDLPIKLFVWNNDGYLSIRATQRKFFEGRFIGTDQTCGVSFPSIEKIAAAYGIQYERLDDSNRLEDELERVLNHPKAVLCEVMCIRDQDIVPTVASIRKDDGTMVSRPLEDMYPFLGRVEFRKEMIVKPIDE